MASQGLTYVSSGNRLKGELLRTCIVIPIGMAMQIELKSSLFGRSTFNFCWCVSSFRFSQMHCCKSTFPQGTNVEPVLYERHLCRCRGLRSLGIISKPYVYARSLFHLIAGRLHCVPSVRTFRFLSIMSCRSNLLLLLIYLTAT